MEIPEEPKECPISGMPCQPFNEDIDIIAYYYKIGGKTKYISIPRDEKILMEKYLDEENEKRWVLRALILNGIWHSEKFTTCATLDKLIETNSALIPKTPKEKKDKLLNYLYRQQKYDGQDITFALDEKKGTNYKFWELLFFKNKEEVDFYTSLLENEELMIVYRMKMPGGPQVITGRVLSATGIEYLINLQEGEYSTSCFVAMSFTNPEMEGIYDNAIKPAIEQTGFTPIRIDKQHLPSDTSINDGIIAAIKKSRFTIADFTDQKNGVYFEAGFALGRGQKVIYTCKVSDVEKLHFDIRSYQQIIWKDAADFKQKLIDKIEAFIK